MGIDIGNNPIHFVGLGDRHRAPAQLALQPSGNHSSPICCWAWSAWRLVVGAHYFLLSRRLNAFAHDLRLMPARYAPNSKDRAPKTRSTRTTGASRGSRCWPTCQPGKQHLTAAALKLLRVFSGCAIALELALPLHLDPTLHLHAQDVIGPVDQLGPFDHARKPRELLLPVLHAAQIPDLRRIGARRNSRPTSASGCRAGKASPRWPRCAWRACRPARLQRRQRPGARRPRAASCPHWADPRRRRSAGRPDGSRVSTRTARRQGHAA